MLRRSMIAFLLALACDSKPVETAPAAPALPVLQAPLDELHTWFDSHRGEARFIAILSPT
jgi:hypothetical protein